jgi:hypothetical protein
VVRQPALGVERPVDGIDDHEHAGVAEIDDAALLGHGREARARLVQGPELGEDGVLRGGVDDQRAVAALAAVTRLGDALAARRVLGQDRDEPLRRAPAGTQPVVGEQPIPGLGSGGHAFHILGTCRVRPIL